MSSMGQSGMVLHFAKALIGAVLTISLAVLLYTESLSSTQNGNYTAKYDVSLAGIGLASIEISAEVEENRYSLVGKGKPAFIGSLFVDGRVTVTSSGMLNGTKIIPDNYTLDFTSDDDSANVNMTVKNNNISTLTAEPPLDEHADRVLITNDHQKRIIDPVSAVLIPMVSDGPTPDACDRSIPVHDGWYRYDINLSYKANERVRSGDYKSEAVICNIRWVPIAGHRTEKENTKFMIENRDMEIWLVPLKGTRVLIPYKVSIKTRNAGTLRFEVSEIKMPNS